MKKRIAAMFAAFALAIGLSALAPISAAASQAALVSGNGTSNYYLTGGCTAKYLSYPGGIYLNATNWDYGPNQYYHLNITRSGVAYAVTGVYVDGVYYGKSLGEYTVWEGGHGQTALRVKGTLWTNPISCTKWL